ncbi:MAG: segregation/condensation protein A, partial [Deltaproteobacteria bacterium]|nr:segregation/condensation protein A [Deltaproteobacteria bacterium]
FELIAAVRKMLLEKKEEAFAHLPSPLIPIENKMEEILASLKQLGRILLEDLLPGHFTRSEIIVVFLSLLELARLQKIIIYQEIQEGNLLIYDFLPPATIS